MNYKNQTYSQIPKIPFCQFKEEEDKWICIKCNAEISKTLSKDKPFAACRVGYAELGLRDFRHVRLVNKDTYRDDSMRVSQTPGPGTELKKIFSKLLSKDILYSQEYNRKFMMMNNWGKITCSKKIESIIDWIREECEKLDKPFIYKNIKALVRLAIKKSK